VGRGDWQEELRAFRNAERYAQHRGSLRQSFLAVARGESES
jgi:hypothetical protein